MAAGFPNVNDLEVNYKSFAHFVAPRSDPLTISPMMNVVRVVAKKEPFHSNFMDYNLFLFFNLPTVSRTANSVAVMVGC